MLKDADYLEYSAVPKCETAQHDNAEDCNLHSAILLLIRVSDIRTFS
jgi:hypothetical protein